MTHTLHRVELKTDLTADFVFLCTPARGFNTKGAASSLAVILDVLMDVGPINIGFYGFERDRLSGKSLKSSLHDNSRLRCVFDSRTKMVEVLRRIKDGDFGFSVAVTGDLSEVLSMAKEAGLKPHTANISLGVFGKTEKLPEKEILEVTTMCGHGMVSACLVRSTFNQVKLGGISMEEALRRLDQPCTCGIVNPVRLRRILEEISGEG